MSDRINEELIMNSNIIQINKFIYDVCRAICKIIIGTKVASGFLIKLYKKDEPFYCLMTNNHVISDEMIEDQEEIEIFFTEQEMNSMNFEQSKKYDTRNIIEIYFSFLNRKQPLLFLFNYYPKKEEKKHRIKFNSLKIIVFCYEIMIYMFIYSSFFGSKSVSKIYFRNFNFGKKFVMGIIIAPFAMIIKSVVYYFIYGLMNKKIVEIKIKIFDKMKRRGLKNEEDLTKEYENLIDEIIKYFKKRLYIFLGITIIVIFLIWCFVSSFCALSTSMT